jgi:methylthioribose-1-phosphate isomerase
MEKDEAKSKLIRLEEENRNLAMRLNETRNEEQQEELTKMKEKYENYRKQTVELTKAVDDAKNKEKEMNKLNENLRQADRKNKILMELIEYQKGPIDNDVDQILS